MKPPAFHGKPEHGFTLGFRPESLPQDDISIYEKAPKRKSGNAFEPGWPDKTREGFSVFRLFPADHTERARMAPKGFVFVLTRALRSVRKDTRIRNRIAGKVRAASTNGSNADTRLSF